MPVLHLELEHFEVLHGGGNRKPRAGQICRIGVGARQTAVNGIGVFRTSFELWDLDSKFVTLALCSTEACILPQLRNRFSNLPDLA